MPTTTKNAPKQRGAKWKHSSHYCTARTVERRAAEFPTASPSRTVKSGVHCLRLLYNATTKILPWITSRVTITNGGLWLQPAPPPLDHKYRTQLLRSKQPWNHFWGNSAQGRGGARTVAAIPHAGAKLDVAMVDMNEIFAAADVISLHLPSIKETQRIINAETIGRMKKGVLLVNVARGECVDEAAVAAAVRAGHVARAALDVFAPEPLAKDSPLLEHDNIIVTPHLGASTQEAQVKVAVDVCEQIREVLNGGVAHAALNIPSMKAHLIHPVQHLLDIAETLGRVMVQLAEAKIKSVSLVVADVPPAADLAPVITCFSKGLLSRVHRDGPVNFVNAPALMKEIGIEAEATRAKVGMIANSVLATAVFENGASLWP